MSELQPADAVMSGLAARISKSGMISSVSSDCKECGGSGWIVAARAGALKTLDGKEIDGHKRAVVRCPHVLTAQGARRDIKIFGSEYDPDASIDAIDRQPGLKAEAERFVREWGSGRGMLLGGPVGVGKSFAMSAICNALLQSNCRSLTFANVPALIREMREVELTSHGPLAAFERWLVAPELLVLDDLGAEKASEWTEALLYTALSQRYGRRAPVLVTFNVSLTQLVAKIGSRSADRLLGFCNGEPLQIVGQSRRWTVKPL